MRSRDIGVCRMRVASMLAVVSLLAGSVAGLAGQSQGTSVAPPGYIEFNGFKDPDAIPMHSAWDAAFRSLQSDKRSGHPRIRLSPADEALVYAEADAQTSRDERCLERQRAKLDEIEKVHGEHPQMRPDQLALTNAALKELRIGCRQEVLEAGERLLARMTPQGRATLHRFVLERRRTMSMFVPIEDLATYRLPR